MAFTKVSEILGKGSRRGPAKGVLLSLGVEKALTELLPQLFPSLADKIKMLSYREGKLNLLTPSSAVSQEAYLNSAVIIKKLNESLGGKVVGVIRFKIRNPKH